MKRGKVMAVAVFIGVCGCEHKDTPATVAPATQPAVAATAADTSADGGAAVTTKPAAAARDAGAKDAAVAAATVTPPQVPIRALRALRANRFPRQPNGAPTVIERPLSPAPATQKQ